MPEVIFTGPAGRLEGRYHPAKQKNAPIAMVLHPHPQFHGNMNHPIVYQVYYAFAASRLLGTALQLPRRRPQPGLVRSRRRRIVGCRLRARLGADHQSRSARLLGRRLLLRRLDRHAATDAPAGGRRLHLDRAGPIATTSPSSRPAPPRAHRAWRQGHRSCRQGRQHAGREAEDAKGIVIDQQTIPGANHFFEEKMEPLMETVTAYLDMRLANVR